MNTSEDVHVRTRSRGKVPGGTEELAVMTVALVLWGTGLAVLCTVRLNGTGSDRDGRN